MAAVAGLVTTVIFQSSYDGIGPNGPCDADCRVAADRSWRIIVGIGAIPACLAMYYRITIPETPRYTFDVQHDVDRADADIRAYISHGRPKEAVSTNQNSEIPPSPLAIPKASWADAKSFFLQPHNMRALIGTAMSWFFLVSSLLRQIGSFTSINTARISRIMESDLITTLCYRPSAMPLASLCITGSEIKPSGSSSSPAPALSRDTGAPYSLSTHLDASRCRCLASSP